MSEIGMLVRVVVKPENLDNVVRAMHVLQTKSRAEEGVLRYDIVKDIESEATFYIQETYKDKDAFKTHARSEHMAAYLAETADCLEAVNMHKVAAIA